ncbi:MAG TPA: patatin-like phospholipase family protein [Burkholderiaceae bacterium]
MRQRIINLALQGGGALGAFTWGVLDRLLEEAYLDFEAVSGSSAGAMNAVALAHGLAEGGRDGAKKTLETLWTAVGGASYPAPVPLANEPPTGSTLMAAPSKFLLGLTRFFSPYQLNPFDINPLRTIIATLFDFERIRRASPLRLFVGATRVRTGALRIFRERELTAEHVLASACLPAINQAVLVDGDAYWDGGYTGNPPLHPLLFECRSLDLMIVLLLPLQRPATPTTADTIRSRLTEIHFNTTFLTEMRDLALSRRVARRATLFRGRLEQRLFGLNMHMIETDDNVNQLAVEKTLNTSLPFLLRLRDEGRARAESWLAQNRSALGRRSTLDMDRFAA